MIKFKLFHDDVIKWKHFPRYRTFVRGIDRSPVNSPHNKGQWRGALMFSLICAWIKGWVNNGEADDLRRYRAHYDVTVMPVIHPTTVYRWFKLCIQVYHTKVKTNISRCHHITSLHIEAWDPFQYPIRRVIVRSRKVSKPRDWQFKLSHRFEIWQANRQQCCRGACKISERADNSKYKSRGFETSRGLTIRRLIGYWNGGLVTHICVIGAALFQAVACHVFSLHLHHCFNTRT